MSTHQQPYYDDEDFNEYCNTLDASLVEVFFGWKFSREPERDMFNGCVENYYQYKVTKHIPSWLILKDNGNDAFKAGNYEKAIQFYMDAYRMTSDKYYALRIIKKGFADNDENTSRRKVIESNDLVLYISQYLYSPPHKVHVEGNFSVQEPNMPAAICLANIALAYMNMDNYETALKYATLSISKCPTYLKAHKRLLSIYEKLKMSHDIERKKTELSKLSTMLPFYACCALATKWLNLETSVFYQMIRFSVILKWLAKYDFSYAATGVLAVIEYYGTRYITMDFTALNEEGNTVKIDGVLIKPVDPDIGFIVDMLHNKGGSYELLEYCVPRVLEKFMIECKDAKVNVCSLTVTRQFDTAYHPIFSRVVYEVNPECTVYFHT